jgi:hypothetical protein
MWWNSTPADRKHIKAHAHGRAVRRGKLQQERMRHPAEDGLLVRIHLHLGGVEIARGAGLDLKDHQRVAVPCDQVEIAGLPLAAPAPRDDGVPEATQMEERRILAALAGQQMRRDGALAVRE